MSSSKPGILGVEPNEQIIDKGTLARTNTPLPGPILQKNAGRKCPCSGMENTTITGLSPIPGYSGNLSSPFPVMWYVPGKDEPFRLSVQDKEIRQWVRQAVGYHKIPHVLLAVILQQENGPNATTTQKVLQFTERSLTTFAAILDNALFDVVPDKVAGGSTGFANMSRSALQSAALYSEKMYGRPPLPDSVKFRILGWNQDTRVSGDDWKADLYYCAAHLRQLIDYVTNRICHNGTISISELEKVIAAYNGSGPLAKKYAKDAMKLLSDAASGKAALYFYE